ncbi:hypothetical protein GCM10027051_31850 [Niabella terrae]
MKKLLLTGLIMLTAFISFAQYRDPKAKAVLDEVSARFKSYSTAVANFGYQLSNAAGKVLATKKGMVQMKGNKYAIDLGGMKIISDGKTVWNYNPEAKEVTVSNVEAGDNSISPQKLFTDFYNKNFSYVLDKDTKVAGRLVNKIILKPVDASKAIARVYLAIDKATKNVVSTTFVEKSGNNYVYSISNFKPDVEVSDAVFTFDKAKYPGVEVVDLR